MLATRCRRVAFPRLFRNFTVLAFESSADDSCAAVVTSDRRILSNVVIKQNEVHNQYGGIHPASAILAHQRNLPVAARRALSEAGIDMSSIDGIAFTRGPGMAGCLAVACNAAKGIAAVNNKPLVAVHHMQAHALTAMLTSYPDIPTFPFATLLVSGGHTLLVLVKAVDSFEILVTTRDEAIGQTIDKVARLLGIGWTGVTLEKFYLNSTSNASLPPDFIPFKRAMVGRDGWSFSGYHSHVERFLNDPPRELLEEEKLPVVMTCMKAIVDHLIDKTVDGLLSCLAKDIPIKHLVVSGGVASNLYIRERLEKALQQKPFDGRIMAQYPPPALCTDNAVMIAWASMHRFLAGDYDDLEIAPISKWSIEELKTN